MDGGSGAVHEKKKHCGDGGTAYPRRGNQGVVAMEEEKKEEKDGKEKEKSATPKMGPLDIWKLVAKDLEVTDEQQKQLMSFQEQVEVMDDDLQLTLDMLKQLRSLIDDKNSSLDQELLEIQKILTPTQTAKFILWVTQNPACMHMLNQLWRHVYERTDDVEVPDKKEGGGPPSPTEKDKNAAATAPAATTIPASATPSS